MATTSEVKTGMDAIAARIAEQRAKVKQAIQFGANAATQLAAIASDYADVVATINAFGTTDAFEAHTKAELAKLTAEFTALKAVADAIKNAQV